MIKFQKLEPLSESHPLWAKLESLHGLVFGGENANGLWDRVSRKYAPTAFVATVGERVVGFKMGYERKSTAYHSWLGGVDPEFRRQGIARGLMKLQHQWCAESGYKSIRTQTKNR
jgi:predicted GNAT superfamily acetyltransferase